MKTRYTFNLICLFAFITLPYTVFAQSWNVYTKAGCPLPDTSVAAVAFDTHGNTWVGMTEAGLMKYNGTAWSQIDDPNMPTITGVTGITWHNGTLWVSPTDQLGLAKYDGTSWSRITTANSGMPNNTPYCTVFDAHGNMWIGSHEGLIEWKTDNTWLTYLSSQATTNFPADFVNGILIGSDGDLWLSFYSAYGMVKFNPTTGVGVAFDGNTVPDLPGDHISSMAVDWGGNIWAATFGYGVARINGTNVTVYSLSTDPAFISNHVFAVSVDQCGNVWIGTDAGVAMYNGSSWTKYTKTNSPLPHNKINALSVTDIGHVWVATDGDGLAEYKPPVQKAYLAAPATSAIIATDSVICTWNWACPGIEKYWFEMSRSASFTNSFVDTSAITFASTPQILRKGLSDHATYYWRVKARNDQGWGPFSDVWQFTVNLPLGVSSSSQSISDFTLDQNTPNPFSDLTTIRFALPTREHVRLSICDLLGREIAVPVNGEVEGGNHEVQFSRTEFSSRMQSSGVYVYKLLYGNRFLERVMQMVR